MWKKINWKLKSDTKLSVNQFNIFPLHLANLWVINDGIWNYQTNSFVMVTFSYRECELEKWQMSQHLLTKPCVVQSGHGSNLYNEIPAFYWQLTTLIVILPRPRISDISSSWIFFISTWYLIMVQFSVLLVISALFTEMSLVGIFIRPPIPIRASFDSNVPPVRGLYAARDQVMFWL